MKGTQIYFKLCQKNGKKIEGDHCLEKDKGSLTETNKENAEVLASLFAFVFKKEPPRQCPIETDVIA